MNIPKVRIFGLFSSFSDGTLKLTPMNSTGKIVPVMFNNISKNVRIDVYSVSKKAKNRQNHIFRGLDWG